MRAIITGARGTVGKALSHALEVHGHHVIPWDRDVVPIDNYRAMEEWVLSTRADTIYNLAIASKPTGRENEGWLVNYDWPSELAWITMLADIRFIYTSTAMVFTNAAKGPFDPTSPPDETEGYGGEKRRAEERVMAQNPQARVARLGWQIGKAAGSNNMIDFFEGNMARDGVVRTSARWLPACSFLEDTADALIRVRDMPAGLYHIDGNRAGNDFHAVATALNKKHGGKWKIERTEDFVYDQRLMDERLPVGEIGERLAGLKKAR